MFIACIGYESSGVRPWIPFHLVVADIVDNGRAIVRYNEGLLHDRKEIGWRCALDLPGSQQGPVAGSYECANGSSGSTKGRNFSAKVLIQLDCLRIYKKKTVCMKDCVCKKKGKTIPVIDRGGP
jgi:hypothetical protein